MKKFSYPKLEPLNFGGLDGQNYEDSRVVVLPVPYDSTTYYMGGARYGPAAIIEASRHMELYDIEQGRDVSKEGIFTLDALEPSKNSPQETIGRVEHVISQIIADEKFPLMLGGEHSLSLGAVRAFHKKYPKNFSVLHFDAHGDLRDEFEGTKFHHGCWLRRAVEDCKVEATQVGIRSVSEEEMDYLHTSTNHHIFYAEKDIKAKDVAATLQDNVYLTIDVDVFDSSVVPSTGTPEPGGLFWPQMIEIIREVAKSKNIVGADVVELAPIPGMVAPDFLVAKLAYKIIGYTHPEKKIPFPALSREKKKVTVSRNGKA